jgi:hypothetical protein
MMKSVVGSMAALLLVTAPFASAGNIKIDFEEFAYGVTIGDYYNHGADSLNRASGAYYGLTFGGTIKFTPSGAYLSHGWMTIDPDAVRSILGTDQYYVKFNAGRYDIDGGPAFVSYEGVNKYDLTWISGNGNPYCGIWPGACDHPYYGSMGGYVLSPWSPTSQIKSIGFDADRVDNIEIVAYTGDTIRPASFEGNYNNARDIPEPTSLALLGIGAGTLFVRRRRERILSERKMREQ